MGGREWMEQGPWRREIVEMATDGSVAEVTTMSVGGKDEWRGVEGTGECVLIVGRR
jgi:hypothetical protein